MIRFRKGRRIRICRRGSDRADAMCAVAPFRKGAASAQQARGI
ncbi:hypothetical protein [Lysobacter gummosus]